MVSQQGHYFPCKCLALAQKPNLLGCHHDRLWLLAFSKRTFRDRRFAQHVTDFRATFAAIKSRSVMGEHTGRCCCPCLDGGFHFLGIKTAANANDHDSHMRQLRMIVNSKMPD